MFGNASPGMVRICALPMFSRLNCVVAFVAPFVPKPSGDDAITARNCGESIGNEIVRASHSNCGDFCSGDFITMRSASSASWFPMRTHSAQSRASLPSGNRLSAVTMPPCALFMKIPTPPPFSSNRSYNGPTRSGLQIPCDEPITSGCTA